MKIKSLALFGALALSIIPLTSFADIIIHNNTNTAATATAGNSQCSGAIPQGVMKPHTTVTIPDFLADMFCKDGCTANVYMSRNCSGKPIATVEASTAKGITKVTNNDKSATGYKVVGLGKEISIEGGAAKKWYELFF